MGVTTLELDTAVTCDGIVVVAHDRRLNPDITRGPDGRWIEAPAPAVHDLSFRELERYDVGRINPASAYAARFPAQRGRDGVRMPTLASVFELARSAGGVRFNIETKISPLAPRETPSPRVFVDSLLKLVRDAGVDDRVSIQSFDWRTLLIVQHTDPRIATSYLTADEYVREGRDSPWTAGFQLREHGSLPRMVRAAAGAADAAWSPDYRGLIRPMVSEALSLGLKVLPWTVNDAQDMERMLDWGVSGFITDYPDRAREVLRKREIPLPAPTPVMER